MSKREGMRFSKKQVMTYLQKNAGNNFLARKALKIDLELDEIPTRQRIQYWIDQYPEIREVCENAQNDLVDVAEGHLTKMARAGDKDAVFYILKTLGKTRGYVEKTINETTISGEMDLSNAPSDDDYKEFLKWKRDQKAKKT